MKKAVTLANCVLAGMTALCLPAALTVHANCFFLDPVPCSKQAGHPNMEGIFLVLFIGPVYLWQFLQQVLKVFERFQPAFLCRFHDAVDDRTGIGSFWGIRKKPVLPSNHEWLDASFCSIV